MMVRCFAVDNVTAYLMMLALGKLSDVDGQVLPC